MKTFILAMLMALMTSIPAQATGLDNIGWIPTKQAEDGKVMKITNMGLRGGMISVGCDKEGDPVKINFTRANSSASDMFIVELMNKEANDKGNYVRAYGLRTMSPIATLNQIELSTQGFVVSFYEEGALNQFYQYRAKKDGAKIPVPIGAEKFAGHEEVKAYTDQIREVCTARLGSPNL